MDYSEKLAPYHARATVSAYGIDEIKTTNARLLARVERLETLLRLYLSTNTWPDIDDQARAALAGEE